MRKGRGLPPSWRDYDRRRRAAGRAKRRWTWLRLAGAASVVFLLGFIGVWLAHDAGADPGSPERSAVQSIDLVGRASVVDGDTIRIAGETVRLNGIDAPEARQTCFDERGMPWRCGAVAASRLDAYLAASRPTRCAPLSRDQYGRVVADCFRSDGENVAVWLVRNGLALDWPRYSHGRFAANETAARNARSGVWRGSFQPPWEWRAANRR